jgi:hypothetical protein
LNQHAQYKKGKRQRPYRKAADFYGVDENDWNSAVNEIFERKHNNMMDDLYAKMLPEDEKISEKPETIVIPEPPKKRAKRELTEREQLFQDFMIRRWEREYGQHTGQGNRFGFIRELQRKWADAARQASA